MVCALFDNAPVCNDVDVVDLGQEMQSMGNKDTSLAGEAVLQDVLENGFADMSIQCRKRVLNNREPIRYLHCERR